MDAKRTAGNRLAAMDVLRGLVMVLMAVDHSSGEFNRGRLMTDATFMWHPGAPLPAAQFLTRWLTHLCAPTFVFLAGASLAISTTRRLARGESAWAIDRHLLARGAVIVAAEIVPSYFWMPPHQYIFQVLYAIGTSYFLMVPLRRLPSAILAGLAVTVLVFGEAIARALGWNAPGAAPLLADLLLVPGPQGHLMVAYPTLYWLSLVLLGFVFGRWLATAPDPRRIGRFLAASGASLLAVFVLVRALNGYGNMGLYREGPGALQWLHVSKYPPSLTFDALELGIGALLLALFFAARQLESSPVARFFTVFGKTPMFFYLLHIPLLAFAAEALGVKQALGLGAAYGFAAAAVLVLYPACRWYGGYKARHPGGVARYI